MNSEELARLARISTVRMTTAANASHVASGLSVVDILAVLYSGVARVHPQSANDANRDRVVFSKGHAAAALYSILSLVGFFPTDWLDEYCSDGASLGGHVTSHGIPGVEFSTGSLGHGLPIGVGIALAAMRKQLDSRVFVIMSDGELDEGTTWESALLGAHHKLSNLVAIVDRNRLQSLASTEETLSLEPLADKFKALNWQVMEVDGHDHISLRVALTAPLTSPLLVIAETTKGKGVSFMEGEVLWHYRPASNEQLDQVLAELRGE